jgi:hypothetical protein
MTRLRLGKDLETYVEIEKDPVSVVFYPFDECKIIDKTLELKPEEAEELIRELINEQGLEVLEVVTNGDLEILEWLK